MRVREDLSSQNRDGVSGADEIYLSSGALLCCSSLITTPAEELLRLTVKAASLGSHTTCVSCVCLMSGKDELIHHSQKPFKSRTPHRGVDRRGARLPRFV